MNQLHCEPHACPTCPYSRTTPPGVWHPDEYAKLRLYDADTWAQPPAVFMCHQRTGALCAGWVAVHGDQLLALRIAAATGKLRMPLPVIAGDFYGSGNEAADAGLAGVAEPDAAARKAIRKLERRGKHARTARQNPTPSERSRP